MIKTHKHMIYKDPTGKNLVGGGKNHIGGGKIMLDFLPRLCARSRFTTFIKFSRVLASFAELSLQLQNSGSG
jgi:hypothetical protein